MIRRIHSILVMLDNDQRIPLVPQVFERIQQPIVVPLMQPDARLIQNVEHPHQTRANLRS